MTINFEKNEIPINNSEYETMIFKYYAKHTQSRQKLIEKIIKNKLWMGNLDGYTSIQLESIIEFGNPYAFADQEYDYRSNIINSDNGLIFSNAPMKIDDNYKHREVELTRELLGNSAAKRVLYALSAEDRVIQHRIKTIKKVLFTLPEKYNNIINYIMDNDINKLAELTSNYQIQKIRKIIIPLLLDRASTLGIYITRDEILKQFNLTMKQAKIFKYKDFLRSSGLIGQTNNYDSVLANSTNILTDMYKNGKINRNELDNGLINIFRFPREFSDVFTISSYKSLVIAVLAIYLNNPSINVRKKVYEYTENEDTAIKVYKSIRRLIGKSKALKNEIEFIKKSKKQNNFHTDIEYLMNDTTIKTILGDTAKGIELLVKLNALYESKPRFDSEELRYPVNFNIMDIDDFLYLGQRGNVSRDINRELKSIIVYQGINFPSITFLYIANKWILTGASVDWNGVKREEMLKRMYEYYPTKMVNILENAPNYTKLNNGNGVIIMKPLRAPNRSRSRNELVLEWRYYHKISNQYEIELENIKKQIQIIKPYLFPNQELIISTECDNYRELANKILNRNDQILSTDLIFTENGWRRVVYYNHNHFPISFMLESYSEKEKQPERGLSSKPLFIFANDKVQYISLLTHIIYKDVEIEWQGYPRTSDIVNYPFRRLILWLDSKENLVKICKNFGINSAEKILENKNIIFLPINRINNLQTLVQFLKEIEFPYGTHIIIPDINTYLNYYYRSNTLKMSIEDYKKLLNSELKEFKEIKLKQLENEVTEYRDKLLKSNNEDKHKITIEEINKIIKEYRETLEQMILREIKMKENEYISREKQFIEDKNIIKLNPNAHDIHVKYGDMEFNTKEVIQNIDKLVNVIKIMENKGLIVTSGFALSKNIVFNSKGKLFINKPNEFDSMILKIYDHLRDSGIKEVKTSLDPLDRKILRFKVDNKLIPISIKNSIV